MRSRVGLAAVLASTLACTGSYADTNAPPAPRPAAVQGPTQVIASQALFVANAAPPAREIAAPWSLTASDGSGLLLTRVDAKAVVEGPLAFTELHLYFHNPEDRTREGTFAITLPAGAAVSRFAMESNGQMMEAEVVEKQLARRAYEDFLHRRQDPALLEKAAGNQFTARVFPIPAKADKHLVISFSQEVSPGHYALPLRGLAKSERVDVRVQVRGKTGALIEQTLSKRNWTPDQDVIVDGSSVGAPASIAAGELVATRLKVELPSAEEKPTSLTVLVDTSASRGLGFAAQARTVKQLVEALARRYGGGMMIQVLAYDQTTEVLYDGRADAVRDLEKALIDRGALGASDLGQALRWLSERSPRSRVVVVTDGVVTAGADPTALPGLVKQLAKRGVERVDVALLGGIRDEQAAGAVARAGLARAGAILDLDQGTAEVARRIGLAVRTELPVAVDGARWVFPRTIAAAQAGDEVTVFARRAGQAAMAVNLAGQRTPLAPVAVTPMFLGRAFAAAEIAELDDQLARQTGGAADKLRAEIVRRSVAARVVSSQTSLLVLESDGDYARYGIDRRALADILAIGPTGVELQHRVAPVQIAQPEPRPRPRPAPKKAPKMAADAADMRVSRSASAARDRAPMKDEADEMEDMPAEKAKGDLGAQGRGLGGAGSSAGGAPADDGYSLLQPQSMPVERPGDAMAEGAAAVTVPAPSRGAVARPSAVAPSPRAARVEPPAEPMALEQREDDGPINNTPALRGPLAEIENALRAGRVDAALARAQAWHAKEPGDVLALIGLGDALEAKRDLDRAARVYGSIIDLYPARADFRRFAGERLERIGKQSRALIIDTYRRAVAQRPDHLTGHRLLAYALVRDGQYAEAFAAILKGIDQPYPSGRFAGAERVLAEDAGMLGAALIAHVPAQRAEVMKQLAQRRLALATQPSTRFLMYWETDANDVDFHIRDARGGHAWYSHRQLPSGGELYADITTGYGPECFAIQGPLKAAPYKLSINYFSQGPMGYGMGLLQIQKFDGQGNLSFEDRPYVIMADHAFVDLGTYR